VESFIGILLAVIIAFIYSWLVTFLLFAMVPVIFVVGILTVKGISVFNEKSKKATETAGKVRVYQVALNVCNKLSMQFPQYVDKTSKSATLLFSDFSGFH